MGGRAFTCSRGVKRFNGYFQNPEWIAGIEAFLALHGCRDKAEARLKLGPFWAYNNSYSIRCLGREALAAKKRTWMARVNADVQAEPDTVHVWVDIFPCEAEQLLFAVTLIYTGSSDFRGSLAAAQYSGAVQIEAASAALYGWCEHNVLIEMKDLLQSVDAVAGLN